MNKEDINLKQDTHDNMMQMIKFTLFSISAGVIQLLSFTLFFEIVKLVYWPSYLIALTLSVLWNFTLNRKFTFKSANNIPIAMTKVAFFYAIFTPLSTWWGDALTKINWNEYLVLGLTMVTNLVLEFLYTKYFVYKNSINTAIKR
jgi:putative flippase GtrA